MHIHAGSMNNQIMSLSATQSAQQAAATKRASQAVRKKLTEFAATSNDAVDRIESEDGAEPRRRQNPHSDAEEFRSVFFSLTV